ncbi:MAG: peptidoglycan DD-metalloendopeptidase family protein [Schaedlerella sp.]|uniref:murein hydrolase activator EnvC family protein n=1 Tax=Mediterraneibacter glycyrrhizinilyticus TaxID=342942 RepID=UPI000E3F8DA5|nr:peptidase M23 [Lachnospiraceae bacterium AM23-2LB]RJV99859.1 peptidase M23 [Lachnospiraceae bacterium AM40-2BH]
MNKRTKRILSGGLIFVMSFGMVINVNATTIDEAQQKADALEQQKSTAEAEKNSLNTQLNTILGEMEDAQTKLADKQTEIEKAEEALVQAKVEENTQYQSMKKRIKYMYENGNSQVIELLMESENIGEFLNKAEYISQISEYDRDMLDEFQAVVKEVEAEEAALQTEYEELEVLRDDLLVKQSNLESLLSEKNLQISDLEKQIGDNAALLQDLIAQAEAERLKQEQAAAAAAAAAQQAAQQQAAQNSGNSGGGSSYVPPVIDNVVSGNGQFTNPCPAGYVSSTFGYRDFDSSFHKGLDLAAPEGTPTYAAADGVVLIAGWSDSAGNWIVIDHGNGFVGKYMHHSGLLVSAGQTVTKGQPIGLVGNTGNSFGAHLHFQLELNGAPVDPQAYF